MSEVLGAFVGPYTVHISSTDEMHKLLTIAVGAWNTALLPPAEQEKRLDELQEGLSPDMAGGIEEFMKELIERKNRDFAQHTRSILSFDLTETGQGYRLNVISTMTLDPSEAD